MPASNCIECNDQCVYKMDSGGAGTGGLFQGFDQKDEQGPVCLLWTEGLGMCKGPGA